MTTFANRISDADVVADLDAIMAAPDYLPDLQRPIDIAYGMNISRGALTNWAARSARTGVRSYGGWYDMNEIKRWVMVRDDDRATRRRRWK